MSDRIKAGPFTAAEARIHLTMRYNLSTREGRRLIDRARQSATGMAAQPTPEGAIWVSEMVTPGGKFMIEFE